MTEGEYASYRSRLILLFISVKILLFLLAFLCSLLVTPYNTSIGLILFPKTNPFISRIDGWLKTLFRPFASWDGAYFLTISLKGYIFEQEHAFFPLYPMLVRTLADTILWPTSHYLSLASRCLLSGVFLSNFCHFVSALTFFDITQIITEDSYYSFLSAAFLVLVPTQAVISAVYSESLFTCLTMLGLIGFYRKERILAALSWCLAGAVRSNGIFLPGFFIYDYIHSARHMTRAKAMLRFVRLGILCTICWSGFLTVLQYGKQLYCTKPSSRPWCSALFPNIYGFVQENYWDVGLFRYYTLKQLPNFILAMPMILFSAFGIYTYLRTDWIWALSLGLAHRELNVRKRPYFSRALLPHVYLWAFMLLYTLLIVHVQIINRLFTFMPVIYWYQAHLYYMAGGDAKNGQFKRQLHLLLLGSFSCITSVLFFTFYPPA